MLLFSYVEVVVGLPTVGKAAKHGELGANDYEWDDGVTNLPPEKQNSDAASKRW